MIIQNRIYVGRAMEQRRGEPCRMINTWRGGGPHNVQIEFADGVRAVCPVRCIRKAVTT